MISRESAQLAAWLEAFDEARQLLVATRPGCIQRVNQAWSILCDLSPEVLPESMQPHWAAVSERACRLAAVESSPESIEEAADIGSVLLCLDWLLQHHPLAPMTELHLTS